MLVDCRTLWLTQLLCETHERRLHAKRQALSDLLPRLPGEIILNGNETNMGVMPLGERSRRYCDEAGVLYQELARSRERVVLTVAGLQLVLKGEPL